MQFFPAIIYVNQLTQWPGTSLPDIKMLVQEISTGNPTALQLTSSATNPFELNEKIFITYN